MADVLSNDEVVYAVQAVFDRFVLGCERIGSSCNAGRPRPFTKAECYVQPIVEFGKIGILVEFQSLFGRGFELISDLKLGKRKYEELNSHFKKAFEVLDEFMKSKSIHEKSIAALLKNGDNLTETVVTTALAEHLLSKLAPGQSYTIDKKCRDKVDVCKCGCKANIKFGDTGIGHEEVWHGFVDIMFSSHDGIESEAAAVMQTIPEPDSDTEPVTENHKQAPDQKESEPCSDKKEDSPNKNSKDVKTDVSGEKSDKGSSGGKCPAEDKVDLVDNEDTDDQTIAQAIVFSLLQKQRHPEFNIFLIPTIVISSTNFKILLYDAENDILLRSQSLNLFLKPGSFEILDSCVIILWMVLHYRIFSSDLKKNDWTIDVDKLKSGFMDRLPPECFEIYKSKLKACVASFPRVITKNTNVGDIDGRLANKRRLLDFGIA